MSQKEGISELDMANTAVVLFPPTQTHKSDLTCHWIHKKNNALRENK